MVEIVSSMRLFNSALIRDVETIFEDGDVKAASLVFFLIFREG